MPRFHFDPIAEDITDGLRHAHATLSMICARVYLVPDLAYPSDVRVGGGRVALLATKRTAAEAPQSAARQQSYCGTPEEFRDWLNERWGRSNVARVCGGGHTVWPSGAERQKFRDRGESIRSAADACAKELAELRHRHHKGTDVLDWRDGPAAFTAAVDECVRRHFPPRMTFARLTADLASYRRKLLHMTDGPAAAIHGEDRAEMHDRVKFFDYWVDRFGLLDAPQPPAPGERTPHRVRAYLKALAAYIAAAPPAAVSYSEPEGGTLPDYALPIAPSRGGGPAPILSSPLDAATPEGDPDFVTLDQISAIVGLTKRTMEKYIGGYKGVVFPTPHKQGSGGNASKWKWPEVRPWLEKNIVPGLPKKFPGNIH